MSRPRDSQRSRVYRAENEALKSLARRYETMDELTGFVHSIVRRTRTLKVAPELKRSITIKDGRGRSNAGGNMSGIIMPVWSRRDYIVLHELSHTIIERRYARSPAWHGWEFCAVYLKLVRSVMGVAAHDALRASFKKHGVRYKPKRKGKPLSPEAKAALVERLTKAREAKLQRAA